MHRYQASLILSLLWVALCATLTLAQQPLLPDFHFESLTMEDGLNFRDVVAIEQDVNGMLWFGTTQGLIRYDGYQFSLFNSDKSNPLFIPEEAIGVGGIASTGYNRLWFLGHSQLFSLDITTFEVLRFGEENGINGDVAVMLLDDKGMLWVVTDDFYNNPGSPQRGNQYLLRQVAADSFAVVHTVPRMESGITFLVQSPDGKITWSTLSQGQLVFSKRGDLLHTIQPDSVVSQGDRIFPGRLYFSTNGGKYFISGDGDVRKYEEAEDSFETVISSDEVIYTATEDHQGNLWFGSARSIYLLTPEGDAHDLTPVIRKELAFGETHQFFLDRQNLFWIATDFGLLKVQFQTRLFEQFLNTGDNNLSSPMRGFTEAADGSILVMNEYERQLYRVSPDDKATRYILSCDTGRSVTSVLNAARFFQTDKTNRYAYTANKYLVRIDLLNNACQVDTSFSPYPDVHNLNPVGMLDDGRVLAGHTLATLQFYEPQTGETEFLVSQDEPFASVENVRYILPSKRPGIIWIGTHENGVFQVEIGKGVVKQISTGSEPALSKDAVLVIYEDVDTTLWIGTFGGGIDHYIPQKNKMQYYDVDDGLSDNNVVGILPQSDSVLWVSTYNGLSRFNTSDITFKNFYVEDGLTHNEFNYASFYEDKSGRFYFGGMDGFIRFSPDSYTPKTDVLPAPRFTQLTKYDRREDEMTVIDLSRQPLKELVITPYDAYFQLQWTIPSYFNNKDHRYYYRMTGEDDEWTFLGNRPFVRFNRMDPGHYILHVKATDFRGGEAAAELEMPIHVRQIFYKTWWFIALCIIASGGLIYALFQYRLRRILEMEKLRTKISSDLHDDLGSMLSGLAMQSEILELKARDEDKPRLQNIATTSRKAVHRMRDLVWSIDARKDRVGDLTDKVREIAEELLPSAGFAFRFDFDEFYHPRKKLNVDARQNLFLIVKESLHNIVKHSNGEQVEVQLLYNADVVMLRIWDNGTDQAEVGANGKTGQGLMNIQMRVQHLGGKSCFDTSNGFELLVEIPAKHIIM